MNSAISVKSLSILSIVVTNYNKLYTCGKGSNYIDYNLASQL